MANKLKNVIRMKEVSKLTGYQYQYLLNILNGNQRKTPEFTIKYIQALKDIKKKLDKEIADHIKLLRKDNIRIYDK